MPDTSALRPLPPPVMPDTPLASKAEWQNPGDVMASIAHDVAAALIAEIDLSGVGGGLGYSEVVVSDGTTNSITVTHSLDTAAVVVAAYNEETGKRIHFSETSLYGDRVTLTAAENIPAGWRIRVVVLASGGSGTGEAGESQNPKFVFEPPDGAAADWDINHGLNCERPHIVIVDDTGQEIHGAVNRRTATANYIQIQFSAPQRGKAYLIRL